MDETITPKSMCGARYIQFKNIPLVAIVILALVAPLAWSEASYAHIDDDELWRRSDTIVIGNVTSITSQGNDHSVEIEVERYLKNPSEASFLLVHYTTHDNREYVSPEGDIVYSVSGNVEWGFNVDERVYVFLRSVTPEYYEVVGEFQGKYSMINDIGVGYGGHRMRIPTPYSPIVLIEGGIGIAFFVTVWIKRDWLFERIVGVNNG